MILAVRRWHRRFWLVLTLLLPLLILAGLWVRRPVPPLAPLPLTQATSTSQTP